ncbi:MAG TPA: response regulator transcription factor [Chloroflexota bacterium]|nr:response regulator transcription factor [Chloroflexota bacterium]
MIEDDPATVLMLQDVLGLAEYRVLSALNAAAAKALLSQTRPDLIILDLILPDADGLVLCASLHARTNIPILVCSATTRQHERVLALKLGASGFIAKPFEIDEFLARVDAILRREQAQARQEHSGASETVRRTLPAQLEPLTIGPLELYLSTRQAKLAGEILDLTPIEQRLLTALINQPDHSLSRQDLVRLTWGNRAVREGRAVNVHIHRLRAKLQAAAERLGVVSPTIAAIRGTGYRILAPPTHQPPQRRQGGAA